MSKYLCSRIKFSRSEKILFEKMYHDYISFLSRFSDRIKDTPVTAQEINEIYDNQFLMKFFILNDKKEYIGFCLVGFSANTHPCTDYYIAEFYIFPKYRRQGFGSAAIKELLSLFPGKYCYHVLKGNHTAWTFWEQIKKECGCKDFVLKDILELSDCDFFAFDCSRQL